MFAFGPKLAGRTSEVRLWPVADMAAARSDVRYQEQSGLGGGR
jgi:hypothetical protein